MQNPAIAKILMSVGILVAVISAFADPLRIGRHPGFGWLQGLGVVIGMVVLFAGFYLRGKAKSSP